MSSRKGLAWPRAVPTSLYVDPIGPIIFPLFSGERPGFIYVRKAGYDKNLLTCRLIPIFIAYNLGLRASRRPYPGTAVTGTKAALHMFVKWICKDWLSTDEY